MAAASVAAEVPPSPRLSASASVLAGGGVGARRALQASEAALEAAQLAQESAAVKEVEAETQARALLASLSAAPADPSDSFAAESAVDAALAAAAARSGQRHTAAYELRLALHDFGDELRSLPMVDGSLQLQPLERLLARMHRTASRLLWRHLTLECGLLELLDAVKSYFLLGRGNIFHTLLDELRPSMGAPPSPLDLGAALGVATSGEPPDRYLSSLSLAFAPIAAAGGGGGGRKVDLRPVARADA